MLELFIIYFSGLLLNMLSIVVYSTWFSFITRNEIENSEKVYKYETYCEECSFKLVTVISIFVPFISLYNIIKYIKLYYGLKKKYSKLDVFDLLYHTDRLSSN